MVFTNSQKGFLKLEKYSGFCVAFGIIEKDYDDRWFRKDIEFGIEGDNSLLLSFNLSDQECNKFWFGFAFQQSEMPEIIRSWKCSDIKESIFKNQLT